MPYKTIEMRLAAFQQAVDDPEVSPESDGETKEKQKFAMKQASEAQKQSLELKKKPLDQMSADQVYKELMIFTQE